MQPSAVVNADHWLRGAADSNTLRTDGLYLLRPPTVPMCGRIDRTRISGSFDRMRPEEEARVAPKNNSVEMLRAGGFQDGPFWPNDNDPNSYGRLLAQIPAEPGVYAFTVGDKVRYIGKAQGRGIRNRFRKYTLAKSWGSTADRVRAGLSKALEEGKQVRVLYLKPSTKPLWRDRLPINLIEGIEAGLIQVLQPAWNMRGRVRDEEDEQIAGPDHRNNGE
jgi:hypothetical protein